MSVWAMKIFATILYQVKFSVVMHINTVLSLCSYNNFQLQRKFFWKNLWVNINEKIVFQLEAWRLYAQFDFRTKYAFTINIKMLTKQLQMHTYNTKILFIHFSTETQKLNTNFCVSINHHWNDIFKWLSILESLIKLLQWY